MAAGDEVARDLADQLVVERVLEAGDSVVFEVEDGVDDERLGAAVFVVIDADGGLDAQAPDEDAARDEAHVRASQASGGRRSLRLISAR